MSQSQPVSRFTGSWLKIKRSKRHFDEFRAAESAFMAPKPYKVVAEYDAEARQCVAKVRITNEIPPEMGVIVGDIVHNLRCALDLLAVDLARMNGHTSHTALKSTYFPISANRQTFETTAQDKIERLDATAKRLIAETQPYKGGNDALYKLHQLDILDKHTLLIPVVTAVVNPCYGFAVAKPPPGVKVSAEATMRLATLNYPLQDGDILATFSDITGPVAQINMGATFSVAFGEGVAKGEAVTPTLQQIGQVVEGIVRTFDKQFPA
jgi:hypothetical protein